VEVPDLVEYGPTPHRKNRGPPVGRWVFPDRVHLPTHEGWMQVLDYHHCGNVRVKPAVGTAPVAVFLTDIACDVIPVRCPPDLNRLRPIQGVQNVVIVSRDTRSNSDKER